MLIDLGVVLHLDLVAGIHLRRVEHVELVEQVDVFLLRVRADGIGRVRVVGKPAARSLFGPFVAVAVAVEDDARMLVEDITADGDRLGLDVVAALEALGVSLEALRDRRIDGGVARREIHRRARHAELEAVAREGERGRAVAVGAVLVETRQNI